MNPREAADYADKCRAEMGDMDLTRGEAAWFVLADAYRAAATPEVDDRSWRPEMAFDAIDGSKAHELPEGSVILDLDDAEFGDFPWSEPMWRAADGMWRLAGESDAFDSAQWIGGQYVVLLRGPGNPKPQHLGRDITTVAGLNRLPVGTILATEGGGVAKRHQWGQWQVTGCVETIDLSDAWLPARVLVLGGEPA